MVMLQSKLTQTYRALHASQSSMGFKLRAVKASVVMAPMTREELAAPLLCFLRSVLRLAGWIDVSQQQSLSCTYLQSPPAQITECYSLQNLTVVVEMPTSMLLIFHPSKSWLSLNTDDYISDNKFS